MLLQLSEDLVELTLTGLVSAKIEEKIPHWFDGSDIDLLIEALNGGHLDDELDTIADDVESKVRPAIMTIVNNIFCGERIGIIGKEDIADRAFKTLATAVIDLRAEIGGYEYERVEREIKKAGANLRKWKVELRGMSKPQKRRWNNNVKSVKK